MPKTRHPRRVSAKVKRARAEAERVLNTPWPDRAVPESITEPMRQRYLRTRQITRTRG